MAQSVAGKIRVDVVGNVGQFTGSMREAKESLGGFTQEYDRAVRGVRSKKGLADIAKTEGEAWRTALHGEVAGFGRQVRQLGSPLLPGLGDLGGELILDKAAAHRRRVLEMLPWGMSTRVTLSREAALTAAAIGDGSKTVGRALGAARGELAMMAGEIGGAAGFGSIARFFTTPGGMALAAAGLGLAKMVGGSVEQFHGAQQARRTSISAGVGVEDASKLLYGGFEPTAIARLQRALWEGNARQEKAFRDLGIDSGSLQNRPLTEVLGHLGDAFERLPNSTQRAALAMDLFGRAGADVLPLLKEFKERLRNMPDFHKTTPGEVERARSIENAMAGAKAGFGTGVGKWLARRWEDLWGYFSDSDPTSGGEARHRRRLREDYAEEHAGEIEAARLQREREAGRIAGEERRRGRLSGMYVDSDVEERKALGISSPLASFQQSMKDLYGAGDLITPGERALQERKLRHQAIGEMLRGYSTVQPAAAMEAGSAEAYSAIVQSQLAEPQIALAEQANLKLDQAVLYLASIAARMAAPGAVLGGPAG